MFADCEATGRQIIKILGGVSVRNIFFNLIRHAELVSASGTHTLETSSG